MNRLTALPTLRCGAPRSLSDTKRNKAQEHHELAGEYVWQVCLVTGALFHCGVRSRVDGELPWREFFPHLLAAGESRERSDSRLP